MERATVGVQGLQQLLDGFKQIGDGLPKELSTGLRTVARDVANDAQAIARARGLYASGELVNRISTSVRGTTAYIVDTARRISPKYPDGYPYPSRYEYEGRQQGPKFGFAKHEVGAWGPRAFIHPAISQDEDRIYAGVEKLIADLIERAGFAPA